MEYDTSGHVKIRQVHVKSGLDVQRHLPANNLLSSRLPERIDEHNGARDS